MDLADLLGAFNQSELVIVSDYISELSNTTRDLDFLYAEEVLSGLNYTEHRLITDYFQTQNETLLALQIALSIPEWENSYNLSQSLGSAIFNMSLT